MLWNKTSSKQLSVKKCERQLFPVKRCIVCRKVSFNCPFFTFILEWKQGSKENLLVMLFHERAIMLGHLKPEIFFVLQLPCWKSSCQSRYHPKEKPLIKILIKGYSNDISVESPRSISLPMTAHNFRWFLGCNVAVMQNFTEQKKKTRRISRISRQS